MGNSDYNRHRRLPFRVSTRLSEQPCGAGIHFSRIWKSMCYVVSMPAEQRIPSLATGAILRANEIAS